MANDELTILATLQDKLSGALKSINDELAKTAKASTETGVQGETGFSKLRLAVTGALGKFEQIGKTVLDAKNKIVGFFAVFGTAGVVLGGLKRMADEIGRLAEQATGLGTTTENLSRLRFVFNQLGANSETAGRAIGKLNQTIGDALKGQNQQAVDAFERLGINISELSRLDAGDALLRVSAAMGDVASASERASIANDLFGRGLGQELLPVVGQGSKALQETSRTAERLNLVIGRDSAQAFDDFGDSFDKLVQTGKGLFREFLEPLLPLATKLLDIASELVGFVSSAFDTLKGLLDLPWSFLVDQVKQAVSGISEFSTALTGAKSSAEALVESMVKIRSAFGARGPGDDVQRPEAPDDLDAQLKRFLDGRRRLVEITREEADEAERLRIESEATAEIMERTAREADQAGLEEELRSQVETQKEMREETERVVQAQLEWAQAARVAADESRNFALGLSDSIGNTAARFDSLRQVGEFAGEALHEGFDGVFRVLTTGQGTLREFTSAFLLEIGRMISKTLLFKAILAGLGIFTSTSGIAGGEAESILASGGIRRAAGGPVPGPRVDRDVVPARLTPGEWVIRRQASEHYGASIMSAINRGLIPRDILARLVPGGSAVNLGRSLAGGGSASPAFAGGGAAGGATLVADEQTMERLLSGGAAALRRFMRDNRDALGLGNPGVR